MSSSRSFTVFVDQPARSASKSSEPLTTLSITTTTADALKENLHPVTGENPSAPSEPGGKKRKCNVLATKSYIPPVTASAAKKGKVEPRKRAAPSGQDGKLLAKKPRCLVSAGRVRTLKGLQKVEEESEPASAVLKATPTIEASSPSKTAVAEGTTAEPNDAALALEELTRALDQVSLEVVSPVVAVQPQPSDGSTIPVTIAVKTQPEITFIDSVPLPRPALISNPLPATPKTAVFTFPVSAKKATKKTNKRKKGKAVAKKGDTAFSTPERKLIYTAFTFSTPSPSSQRFAAASRPVGMEAPRFGDSKYSFGF